MNPCDYASETDLIRRCKDGNLEGFDALIAPYARSMSLVTYSILQNQEDAEEAVQETVLKAFTHIAQLRDDESFKAWLMQIAANEARMRLRRHGVRQFVSVEGEIQDREHQPDQFIDWRNTPSSALEQKELRSALIHGVHSLNESYRTVFVLRDVEHLNSAETARILGISEAAVDTKLHRARLQMREHLKVFFCRPARKWIPLSLRMMALMGKTMVRKVISCRRVMAELSNYIDERVCDEIRKAIEEHLLLCDRCSTVLDTTRKLLYIVADDKVFDLPFKCKPNTQDIVRKSLFPASSA